MSINRRQALTAIAMGASGVIAAACIVEEFFRIECLPQSLPDGITLARISFENNEWSVQSQKTTAVARVFFFLLMVVTSLLVIRRVR